jgi:hypothetical protein
MARDCYKRQQGTTPVTIKKNTTNVDSSQPTTHELKPALIQFQQFPTFVKRKLEGTNYHEPDESSSSNQDNDSHLSTDDPDTTVTIDDDDETDVSTWGTKTDTTNRETQNTWGTASNTKQTRHNSPDLNAYRSGMCTYCDCSIGSKRMHGPLICHECRIFLKEDEEHEKEQQAYEDRRQAKYAAQLAGDNNKTETDNKESTQEEQHNNEDTYDVVPSPSSPRELPQNFTRVTLEQVFILGLQDAKVFKQTRQDGHVL